VLGPDAVLGEVRAVWLVENSPGRWDFGTIGEVRPFEDVGAYGLRRRVDRFTE